MGDIHYIVNKLNQVPFQYNLTLLSFSDYSPQQLLQLLSDVFTKISPKHQNVDISKENIDNTVERLASFLKIVKYNPNYDLVTFRQLLAAGEKDVIYPILKWVVPQPQMLEKRAFVGHYMSFPDMPEELNFDPDISLLKEEIKLLQDDFVETHKESEAVKSLNRDKQNLKAKVKGYEEEKERLSDKVDRARSQVDKVADKSSYMEVCVALRKQQDKEVELSSQMQNQKLLLEKAEANFSKASARLKELSASYQEGSVTKVIESLTEDVNNLRFQVNERNIKELEKRQKRAAALQEAFASGGNTEIDLDQLQKKANTLKGEIAEITERRATEDRQRQGDKAYLQLRQAQQMASMVARKKDDLAAKIERLQEKKAGLMAHAEKLTASDGNTEGMVSDEEWRAKYEAMKSALPAYKKMKKELGDIEAEVFVLAYTEEVLAAEEASLVSQLKAVERQKGITGFTDVVSGMEKVSEAKSAADEVKGMTLSDISRTVEEINASINDRKAKLAPQIKQLRQLRQEFTDLEEEHKRVKSEYDEAFSKYQSPVDALENEVVGIRQEVMDNESKYHMLHCQLNLTDERIKKISGPLAENLKDKYAMYVDAAEKQLKELLAKRRKLTETHTTGLSQIDMMNDLIQLLQVKMECVQRDMDPHLRSSGGVADAGGGAPRGLDRGPQQHSFNTPSANVFVL